MTARDAARRDRLRAEKLARVLALFAIQAWELSEIVSAFAAVRADERENCARLRPLFSAEANRTWSKAIRARGAQGRRG
jgi:hypothetical protein